MKYLISIIGLTVSCSLLATGSETASSSKEYYYVARNLEALTLAQQYVRTPRIAGGVVSVKKDLHRTPNISIIDMTPGSEPLNYEYEYPEEDKMEEIITKITSHPSLQEFLRNFMHQSGFSDACRTQVMEGLATSGANGIVKKTFIIGSNDSFLFSEIYSLPGKIYILDSQMRPSISIESKDGSSLGTFTLNSEFPVEASGEIKKEIKHFYASTIHPELFEALIAHCDGLKTLGLKKMITPPESLREVIEHYQFGDLTRYLLGFSRPI